MAADPQRVPIAVLGEAKHPSPLDRTPLPGARVGRFIGQDRWVRHAAEIDAGGAIGEDLAFEKAGPRSALFFDPRRCRAAVVTCGGLCPGLNNVIRSLFLELHLNYGVPEVLGIRYGYQGLNEAEGEPPVPLSMERVADIHEEGGTILGSSRGDQRPEVMVDFLARRQIDMLFCVGGDGTQRGAHAVAEEVARRKLPIAVVGIPKTIDNDLLYCDRSFGFTTAVDIAQKVIISAHVESKGAPYGIGLVKLMGRESGFITAAATVASQEVNFALVPESPFALAGESGLLARLQQRLLARQHAVIVVAEGAGQQLFTAPAAGRDASGNIKFHDIGIFLKQQIIAHFAAAAPAVNLKYLDPSYFIRSVPANCEDDILCDQFARRAAHAAMAGKTDLVIGLVNSHFVHVPIAMAAHHKRRLDLEGELWSAVLSATGQPRSLV